MLLENKYNNGTLLIPHYEAHKKYTSGYYLDACRSVSTLIAYQCEFVKSTKSCHEIEGYFDYSYLVYCIILRSAGSEQIVFAHIFLTFLIILYAGFAANITYTKMGPNLIALMKIIKFSEHATGSVIISIIYGLPSLLMGHSYHLRTEDSALYITLILGIDLYAKTLAVGILILYIYPLRIYSRYLKRDIIFFTLFMIAFTNMVNRYETEPPLMKGIIIISIWFMYSFLALIEDYYFIYVYKGELDPLQNACVIHIRKREAIKYDTANHNLFTQFFLKINPLKMENFYSNKKCLQVLYFLCFPLRMIIDLIIPAVDYNIIHNGWIKLFNCINIITLPITVMIIHQFPILIIGYVTIVTFILSIIVFFTSRTDRPPKYHYIFSFFGLAGSIIINNFLTNELLSALSLAGIMFRLSRGANTLLLLAPMETFLVIVLGLSIADYGCPIVSYTIFRTRGFIEIAGLGTTIITAAIINKQDQFSMRAGIFGETAIYFIFIETALTIVTSFITNANFRPSLGWFFITFFVFIILFMLAIQVKLIHGLTTDHLNELLEESGWENVNWA